MMTGSDLHDEENYRVFRKLFNEIYWNLGNFTKKAERVSAVEPLRDLLTQYISAGLDLDRIDPKLEGAERPVWLAGLLLLEKALCKSNKLSERIKFIEQETQMALEANPSFALVGSNSLTGFSCWAQSWGLSSLIAGHDINLKNSDVPTYFACVINSSEPKLNTMAKEVMDEIYRHDKDVDRPTALSGRTALMRAAAHTNSEQINWLLGHNADVNRKDYKAGATPIMHAINRYFGIGDNNIRRHLRTTLDLLIERGADIYLKPNTGEDFGELIRNCKALKGDDKKYYKEFWKQQKKDVESSPPIKKYLLEGSVTGKEIRQLQSDTDFLLFPTPNLLNTLIFFLVDKGITQFTSDDIARMVNQDFHGYDVSFVSGKYTAKKMRDYLNRIVTGADDVQVDLYLSEDGVYTVIADGAQKNVVDTQ